MSDQNTHDMLSWAELHEMTGASFSRLQKMVTDGTIPRHGGRYGRRRFSRKDVTALIEKGAFATRAAVQTPPPPPIPADWVPLSRVASDAGVSLSTIRRLIERENIPLQRSVGRQVWLLREDAAKILTDERGRPVASPGDLVPLWVATNILGVTSPTLIAHRKKWKIRTYRVAGGVCRYSEAEVRRAAQRITWDGKRGNGRRVVYE